MADGPVDPSPASRSGPARRPIPKTTSHVDLPSTGPINPLDSPWTVATPPVHPQPAPR